MAVVGSSEAGAVKPVEVICPACGEGLQPQKAAVMLHCAFTPEAQLAALVGKASADMLGVRAFLCQCGCIFSPMTPPAVEEWNRRHKAQAVSLKKMVEEQKKT